jgi:cyclophilin family peptidyl-prolyl cis-trans isomerase
MGISSMRFGAHLFASWSRRRQTIAKGSVRSGQLALCLLVAFTAADALANPVVRIDYNRPLTSRLRRTAFIQLYDDRPLTRDNFLQYVDGGLYDDSLVHRLAKNFVLQAGGYYPEFQLEPTLTNPNVSLNPNKVIDLDGNLSTPNPTVPNEYGNSPTRSNVRGTVAMARRGGLPNSADSEWFVNLGNNSGLDSVDGGFTVFGHVIGDGMNLYDAYNGLSAINLNQDANNDGARDSGPFYIGAGDGVPVLPSDPSKILIIEEAERIDYFGNGLTTHAPGRGLALTVRDAFIDTGTLFTGTGGITVGPGRSLGIREGFNLQRNLDNYGTVSPGLEIGAITAKNFFQFPSGTLDIQLWGPTVDTQYDRMVATESAFLGGTLDVSLAGGYFPAPGSSFTVVSAASLVGDFSSLSLGMLSPGLVWDYRRTPTAITLSVALADFNRDGVADAADYVLWRKYNNTSVTAWTGADANGDGLVNNADLDVWRANLGNIRGTTGGGAGAVASMVPEPASAFLLLICGVFAASVRARRFATIL